MYRPYTSYSMYPIPCILLRVFHFMCPTPCIPLHMYSTPCVFHSMCPTLCVFHPCIPLRVYSPLCISRSVLIRLPVYSTPFVSNSIYIQLRVFYFYILLRVYPTPCPTLCVSHFVCVRFCACLTPISYSECPASFMFHPMYPTSCMSYFMCPTPRMSHVSPTMYIPLFVCPALCVLLCTSMFHFVCVPLFVNFTFCLYILLLVCLLLGCAKSYCISTVVGDLILSMNPFQ